MLDALIVAPHPDDAELGMGGTILRLKAEGWRVGVLDLTDGEPTPFGSRAIRAAETDAATKLLQLDWRKNLGLVNRSLEHTLEARRLLAGVFRQTRPRLVFAPYWIDAHPDHVAATELIEASRFWAKLSKSDLPGEPFHPPRLVYYFCVHLRQTVAPSFVVDISPYWEQKRAAIECYHSQFIAGRNEVPSFLDQWQQQGGYWGWTIGKAYGEPFALREPVGLSSLRDLL